MGLRRSLRKFFKKKQEKNTSKIINVYGSEYDKHVLISYITAPFVEANHFAHQNYITSHIIAESFSLLGYNVDIVNYDDGGMNIDYSKYAVIFGFGRNFESSFYHPDRNILRFRFITGTHPDLQNAMGLKSVRDFHQLSGLWLPGEASVLAYNNYYSVFDADIAVVLARGYVYDDYQSKFERKVYSLNNNILGAFNEFKPKTIEGRNSSFLFLCGVKLLVKGIHVLLEVAKMRPELNFYIVTHSLNENIASHYKEVLELDNVFRYEAITMNSDQMREVIETCTYSIAPSYADALPGGTIEPMSAGLIPIVSRYCGFPQKEFIFEMEEPSPDMLNNMIDKVLAIDDSTYLEYSHQAKAYARKNFSKESVKEELINILKAAI